MRTTNNLQKTGNKPITKTISKTFAIVISLVLISFTVSAQVFWKHLLVNNTYGEMAELMVEQKNADDQLLNARTNVTTRAITAETLQDNRLQSAPQMTFESYFGSDWIANQNIMKTHERIDWRLDESTRNK